MQLTLHTDYALRTLIYLQAGSERSVTVGEIASAYDVSRHHLLKIVQRLSQQGYVQTTRGRGGGLRLAQPPESISLGQVVRQMEPHLDMAECFDQVRNTCPLSAACDLKRVLYEARSAFLAVLDGYTIADLTRQPAALRQLLQIAEPPPVDQP